MKDFVAESYNTSKSFEEEFVEFSNSYFPLDVFYVKEYYIFVYRKK